MTVAATFSRDRRGPKAAKEIDIIIFCKFCRPVRDNRPVA
ncbi:hypothetical protein D1AOALGA4SA_2901 [Olavius algarvensis Delta 1 endosymbiont]|nr:hypothetical protein D1AOALGA4SA_2901 [Olavius algarvensis Delta 1 endosymbiont]